MKKTNIFILSSLLIIMVSCYKYPDLNVSDQDQDMSITVYNKDTDFSNYKTYHLTDTVSFIYSKNDETIDSVLTDEDASVYLSSVRENMNNLGYIEKNNDSADIFIDINILNDIDDGIYLNVAYPIYPGWGWGWGYDSWGGYYGGYYGGWYYPYYYPTYYYNSVGTVLIDLIDLNISKIDPDTGKEFFEAQWTGILKGLLNNGSPSNQRIKSGINQCFDQSNYLNTNK